MPELPEVEVVRRGLAQHVQNRRIENVEVLHPRAVRRQDEGALHFASVLAGRTLTGTGRRGKFLWLATDDPDLVLAAHLGMSGQFRVDGPAGPTPAELAPETRAPAERTGGDGAALTTGVRRHARARFDLDVGRLWFVDQRTFGWVSACRVVADGSGRSVPDLVRDIAQDPIDPEFDARAVARLMRRRHVEIKRLLLDQSLVSGIGNIYADEALWRAGIHPRRRADRLTLAAVGSVLAAAGAVLAASLAQGGTSFDSLYVNVNGSSGYYGRDLVVYGQAGLPCPRCGTPVIRERFMNRSSHLCPRCQPPPRARH